MVCFYLWNLPLRAVLWGPTGLLPYAAYMRTSSADMLQLYRYSASPAYAEFLYWTSVFVAIAFLVGVVPRLTSWLFAITAYATVSRNWQATDAGLNLVLLLAFLLCFCDSGSSRLFRIDLRPLGFRFREIRPIWNLVHNCARFLIAWQVCMVYFWAVFYKLGGDNWRDGTALYYVLHLSHFMPFPALSSLLSSNSTLVAFMTYATIVFQMAFPFLMWNPRLKPYLIGGAVLLHLSIAIVLGLVLFSATMIAADLSLLTDSQMLGLRRAVARAFRFVTQIAHAKRTVIVRAPVFLLGFLILAFAGRGTARAAAEFCPATVSPVFQGLSPSEYAFTLGAMSKRDVTGLLRIQTSSGWFDADFKDVQLRSTTSQYNDAGSAFTLDDFLSTPLVVAFPGAVSVTYAYVARASTSGETVLGWDAKGRHVGMETPNTPAMDLKKAINLKAHSVETALMSNCGDPFSLVGIQKIAYAQYPALLRDSAFTALPKGSSIVIVAVNDDGTVIDAWTWETSGNEALDAAATTAAEHTVYSPARAFCENVPGYYFMKIAWRA